MPPSHELLEALTPDQASLNAAKKLLALKKWPVLELDEKYLWGHCQGSGSTPYRVVYCLPDRGYKCTCPSRKFPCKHVLALMWIRADQGEAFSPGSAPEWIAEWSARRRPNASEAKADNAAVDKKLEARVSDAQVIDARPKDPEASERARKRNAAKREKMILAGLDELGVWVNDQLARGLASFGSHAAESCQTISRRLNDAKAPGLALRVATLGNGYYGWPESQRSRRLLAELGSLHTIAEAYLRQDSLAPGLRSDVRATVGWTTTREEILQDASKLRKTGSWLVGCVRSSPQPDRMRRTETWLVGVSPENDGVHALLLDFFPAATSARSAFQEGDVLTAELAFYDSARPLRAQVAVDGGTNSTTPLSAHGLGAPLSVEMAAVDDALAIVPWRSVFPLFANDLQLGIDSGGAPWLKDAAGEIALPLDPSETLDLAPLLGLDPWAGFVLWDGYVATLGIAFTSLGIWRSA